MNRLNSAARARRLACLVPALMLAATLFSVSLLQGQSSDRAKQVGAKMVCMCGCGQVLTECNHIDCPVGPVMLKKVDQRIASGDSDDLLVTVFHSGIWRAGFVRAAGARIQPRRMDHSDYCIWRGAGSGDRGDSASGAAVFRIGIWLRLRVRRFPRMRSIAAGTRPTGNR